MNIKNELEKKIEKEKQKIAELRASLDKAESFVAGLQEALRMMPKDGAPEKRAEFIMRPGSDMSKARDFLKQASKPMHINEILKGLGKEVNSSNKTSISGSLDNYVRRQQVFTKTAARTYGLVEFANEVANEPPPGFGLSTDKEEDDQTF
jgi:hypothetical protein